MPKCRATSRSHVCRTSIVIDRHTSPPFVEIRRQCPIKVRVTRNSNLTVVSISHSVKESWRTHLDAIAKHKSCVGFLAESCINPRMRSTSDRVQSHLRSCTVRSYDIAREQLYPSARRWDVHWWCGRYVWHRCGYTARTKGVS